MVVLRSIIKVQPRLSKSPDNLSPDERLGLDPKVEEGVNPVYSSSQPLQGWSFQRALSVGIFLIKTPTRVDQQWIYLGFTKLSTKTYTEMLQRKCRLYSSWLTKIYTTVGNQI